MGIVRNRRAWATLAAAATVVGFGVVGSGGVVSPAQGAASGPAGSRAVISGGVLSNPLICEVVILASGTWTPPAGVTSVDVIVVGGGGGGGGGAGNYSTWNGSAYTVSGTQILSGGGGGGGEVVHAQVAVSGAVTVTIGAGGATGTSANANGSIPATDGGDGGTTTFDTVSAQGGQGGKSGANGGTGGAAGGGAAGGSGLQALQALQANPQFTAGGGGGGAGGVGGNAEAVSVNYGTFTPQQDMLAGASGAKYAFVNDGSLWSSANFGTGVNATPYGLTYYPLGLGGVGGSSIVGDSSQCNETVVGSMRRQQGVNPPSYGTAACWYSATNSAPFGNAATARYNTNATYLQANAGAGGNGLVGDRGNQGTGVGNGGAVLIRFYADGGPVPTPVRPTAPAFTASTPPTTGTVGATYDGYAFAASGTAPITFTSSGTLPPGLTLASNGTLSGTPTTAGSYTFTVTATNGTSPDATVTITITVAATGGGGGGGGGTEPATEPTPAPTPTATPTAAPTVTIDPLDPINNPDNSNVPTRGVVPGGSLLLVNGAPIPVTVVPNAKQDPTGLDVRGDDWSMKLVGRGDTSDPLGLTEKQVLILQSEQLRTRTEKVQPVAQASGTGFKASSEVKFYILPSTYLGSLTTDASGAFSGTVPVPAGITPGSHTLQMNGYSPSSQVRSLSIGVVVKATSAKVRTSKASAQVLFAPMSAHLTASGKSHLKALVKNTGTNASAIASVGYVQKSGTSANDQSLSTARARNVASYLRTLGLKGAYTVRGDGIGGPTAADRKVVVTVTYRK